MSALYWNVSRFCIPIRFVWYSIDLHRIRSGRQTVQSQKRIFDDIAKVAGGALGALGSLKQEIEGLVRQRMDRFMADHDLVTREEFEAVKDMASEARAEQERLSKKIAKLEAQLSSPRSSKPKSKATTRKKTVTTKK